MSLFLAELSLDLSTKEKRQAIVERVEEVIKAGGTDTGRLVAGPWLSLESTTMWVVTDIPDVSKTLEETARLTIAGLLVERRLRPIAEWADVLEVAGKIDG